jgi:hypothetical protein
MPRGDGTGPMGMGPMTGRDAGVCARFGTPGYLNSRPGRGLGFGRGRGYGRVFWAAGMIPGCAYFAYRWVKRGRGR